MAQNLEDLTPEQTEALKAERFAKREKNWQNLFERYGKDGDGDLEDVVDWDNEDGLADEDDDCDDDKEMEADESYTEKENIDVDRNENEICIEVSSDEETQMDFVSAFQQCASERIDTVRKVYQKHVHEEKRSKDGLYETRDEKVLKTHDRMSVLNSPGQPLASRSIVKALKGINRHQAIDNGNRCYHLVKPAHNIDGDTHDGLGRMVDSSIINNKLIHEKGVAYYEEQVTTTKTIVTVTRQLIMAPDAMQNRPDSTLMDPIMDDDSDGEVGPSVTKRSKRLHSTAKSTTTKASNYGTHTRHSKYEASSKQCNTSSSMQSNWTDVIEIASTASKTIGTPKTPKNSTRLAICGEIHLNSKDVEKSIKERCPEADTDHLKKRNYTLEGERESLLAICSSPDAAPRKGADMLLRMIKTPKTIISKQIEY